MVQVCLKPVGGSDSKRFPALVHRTTPTALPMAHQLILHCGREDAANVEREDIRGMQ